MKPPAFQFYADDFLAGTFAMSNEERGLYIVLLCRQWTQGHVTKEEMARLSVGMAQPLASHVFAKFEEVETGVFQNSRMELEREKQTQFRANRSESGKAGANKRWHSHSSAITQPMAKHSSPSPSPSPSYNIKREPNKFVKPTIEELKMAMAKVGLPESEAHNFLNHYECNGWRVGKTKMVSWPHAIGKWASNYRSGVFKPTEQRQLMPNHAGGF